MGTLSVCFCLAPDNFQNKIYSVFILFCFTSNLFKVFSKKKDMNFKKGKVREKYGIIQIEKIDFQNQKIRSSNLRNIKCGIIICKVVHKSKVLLIVRIATLFATFFFIPCTLMVL